MEPQKTMESQKTIKSQETMETKEIRQTKEIVKSSKITLAILASLSCLLLLFAGVNNLQAQEARQQGWSIGVSPFYLGAKIKSTTENTTLTEVVTTGTRTFVTADIEFTASTTDAVERYLNTSASVVSLLADNEIAISAVVDICKDGTYDGAGYYNARQFDANSNADATAETNTKADACFKHFQGLANSFSDLTGTNVNSFLSPPSVSSENTSLSGNGLQLGYDFEKFRLSLSLHQWSAGDNKLDSQIVLVDWHLPYGLYAGAGLAQAKLETSIGSDSKIAPAVHLGYKRNFSKNFSIEAGLLWVGAKLSIKQSAAAPVATRTSVALPATPSPITSPRVLVGGDLTGQINNDSIYFSDNRENIYNRNIIAKEDKRILVERIVTPIYTGGQSKTTTRTVPTKTTIEVEAPASLFIRFVYLFK